MAKPPKAPKRPKAPSRAKAPKAPKAPQGPKVGQTQGPPPVALEQVSVQRPTAPLERPTIPQPSPGLPGATSMGSQVAGGKHVVHHQVGPNTMVSHVRAIIPHPDGPMIRHATHVNHTVGPGTVIRKSVIHTRKATPNPNTRLRNSGHPNAFQFGKKPPV